MFGKAEFVSCMCAYGVMSHELRGDLFRKCGIESSLNVKSREFLMFTGRVR